MGEHPVDCGRCVLNATTEGSALDAFFAHYWDRHPVTATFTGLHAGDHRLPDWSRDARDAELAELQRLSVRLLAEHPMPADGYAGLARDDRAVDGELARANIDVRVGEFRSGFFHDRNPALWTGEAIFGVVSLMIRPFAPAAERVTRISARLRAIPRFLATMQSTIQGPVPSLWCDRARRECAAAQSLFEGGLTKWLAASGIVETDVVLADAAFACTAFAAAYAWLADLPAADATGYSCGEELLALMLARGHFCEHSPRDLLARADAAIQVENTRLSEALRRANMDWSAAQAAMAAQHADVDDYYAAFTVRWWEIHDTVIAADVVTWPEWPIRYVPIPDWARDAQPALYWLFYRSPAPFDPYTRYDYVVTPIDDSMADDVQAARLAVWNDSTITLNHVVHHGGIGHHVQNWHAIHRSTSRVGTIAAVDAASRISMFLGGSMAEGWACYATQLAEELGSLTPLETLSEQHSRVRFLARAIVDMRLHLGDWSFTTCVQYYQTQVGMSVEAATAESTKNSMFPATAVMYWLGTQGILDLRAQMQERQGERFSLKRFHDELLSRGAIPVPLAANLMRSELEG